MRADLVALALRQLADALEAPSSSSSPASSPRWYTRSTLPPGCATWRSARETAQRLGVATSKPGRELLIDAADFDAKIAASKRGAAVVTSSDEKTLERMGIVLPMRGAR